MQKIKDLDGVAHLADFASLVATILRGKQRDIKENLKSFSSTLVVIHALEVRNALNTSDDYKSYDLSLTGVILSSDFGIKESK